MELDFANGLLSALGLSYSDPHVIFKVEPWFGLLRQVIGCGHWLPVRPACSLFPIAIVQSCLIIELQAPSTASQARPTVRAFGFR